MARKVAQVYAVSSVYIDPGNCDSTVSYKVVRGSRLYGTVQLADCSRKVDWFFSNDKSSLPKIDKAIQALQEFRTQFAKALASKPKRAPRAKAK